MSSLSNFVNVHPLNASLKSVNEEQDTTRRHLMTIDERGSSDKQRYDASLENDPKKKQNRLKRLKYTKQPDARLESS